jgi:XapX domain-containing protein
MKACLLGAGPFVGILYSLVKVRSPAPPVMSAFL